MNKIEAEKRISILSWFIKNANESIDKARNKRDETIKIAQESCSEFVNSMEHEQDRARSEIWALKEKFSIEG